MQPVTSLSTSAHSGSSRLARWVHWLSAAFIVGAFGLAWARDALDGDTLRAALLGWHRQLGLLVLVLLVLRWLGRWRQGAQTATPPLPTLLHWAGVLSHLALYGLLLGMPLLGWSMSNAQGHEVALFKLLPLPTLTGTDPDFADTLQDWHELASWCLLGLVGMHLLAALWHHWVRRDDVLARMVPWARRHHH